MKKVVIVGPGGLGGTVAALLAHRGLCDVTIVGRPGAHIDAIRQNGLHLGGREEFTVELNAVDDARNIQTCDALIYATKAQDTPAALEETAHIEVDDFVASLQNGTIKDDLLASVFGREKVVGAVAIVAGERPGPGAVNWTYDGGTQFGELDGSSSARVDYIADLFRQSGFIAEATDAILSATWSKMVGWIPIGLFATLARKTNAEILSNRRLATEYVGMVRELSALAAIRGIALADLGPYHIEAWNRGTVEEAVDLVMSSPLAGSQSIHSAFQDIQKGLATEFSACVGPMLEDARENGIAMTAVQVMYAALLGLEETLEK